MTRNERPNFRVDRVQGEGASGTNSSTKKPEPVSVTYPKGRWDWGDPDTVQIVEDARYIDPSLVETPESRRPDSDADIPVVETLPYSGPSDIDPAMLRELEAGTYHVGNIIETFGVNWDRTKCARDVWQNFFDASGYDLSGIEPEITQHGDMYRVVIRGAAVYDPRKLLHVGATDKQHDSRAAGGFGEGTAITSFVMLRDFQTSKVEFAAPGWVVDFRIDNVPSGRTTERQRGLFAKMDHTEPDAMEGNYIVIETRDPKLVEALVAAKDLFYHEDNPDFQTPSFESDFGGFKVLTEGEYPKGHLYDALQRRHYEKTDSWDTLSYMHLWTNHKTLPKDRDRGKTDSFEVDKSMIKPWVESLTIDECEAALFALEPIWDEGGSYEPNYKLLDGVVEKLAAAGKSYTFDDTNLAYNMFDYHVGNLLKEQGYRLCPGVMKKIGMKTMSEKYKELQTHFRVEANPEQNRKIELLRNATRLLGRDSREVWLFSQVDEKNISRGQGGNAEYSWISTEELEQPFHVALATYLHEQDHDKGSDQSAEFSYALTDTIGTVMQIMLERPEEFQRLRDAW